MNFINFTGLLFAISLFTNDKTMEKPAFHQKLAAYCSTIEAEFTLIPKERQAQLQEIGAYIREKRAIGETVQFTVICTHNSRRSHIGQLWLKAAAVYYGLDAVATFSGGTEATAFNPRAVEAMKKAGFEIVAGSGPDNPKYEASMGPNLENMVLFSKKYDHPMNPKSNFAAIMVCSEADAACPLVPGADGRFAIPYEDPKKFDGTPTEAQAYEERCRQIAREMFFAVKNAL